MRESVSLLFLMRDTPFGGRGSRHSVVLLEEYGDRCETCLCIIPQPNIAVGDASFEADGGCFHHHHTKTSQGKSAIMRGAIDVHNSSVASYWNIGVRAK
jgi:hypothetical protein